MEMFDATGRQVRQESRAASAGSWLEVKADRREGGAPLALGRLLPSSESERHVCRSPCCLCALGPFVSSRAAGS